MNRATFDAHQHLIAQGETTPVTELPYLTDEEQSLFRLLNQNGWRIEQERLGEEWVGEGLLNGDHTPGRLLGIFIVNLPLILNRHK